jgi:hypothetical protein
MATPQDENKGLPKVPSAGALSMTNYYPATTPATQRLGIMSNTVTGNNTSGKRLVYVGQIQEQVAGGIPYKDPSKGVTVTKDRLVDVADARYMMYTLAPEARKRLNDITTKYFQHNRWAPSWQDGVWEQAIQVSANSVAYGNKGDWIDPVTAFDLVVNDMARSGGGAAGAAGGGAYSGPVTSTQITKSENLTNPSTARSLIKQSLTSYLGRDATEDEQNSFLKALNAAEKRSPSVTKSVSTTTPGVGTSRTESETSSRGGFNPSTFAEEYAQGQEGAAEFQAATTLLDTFIGSLGARV